MKHSIVAAIFVESKHCPVSYVAAINSRAVQSAVAGFHDAPVRIASTKTVEAMDYGVATAILVQAKHRPET